MRKTIMASAAVAAFAAVCAAAILAAPSEGDARKRIIETAVAFQGVPYVYGAESPEAFDCSGFVQYVYAHAAEISLPRNSKGQWAEGQEIDKSAVKPGDIFVFDTVGSGGPSHVAIFMGDGKMIHAVSEGPKTGVIISPITDRYFGPRMIGARYFIVSAMPSAVAPAKPAAQPAAPAPAKPAAQPAALPAAPAPVAVKPAVPALAKEPPVAQIGFTLRAEPAVVNDKIPAATGTAIAFTITNGTGKDGVFHIIFYKADIDFKKTLILREEKAMIRAGESQEIPAYTFAEPGIYRLNVKTADNTQLMQRSWKVVSVKP
jgi:hypothetical protein